MDTDRPLRLEVTDLGPVARACVDLRPLTVFVGPSNTGKTWLATVAYALHRHFATGPQEWRPRFPIEPDEPDLPDGTSTELLRIAEWLTASTSGTANPMAQGIALTPVVEAAVRRHLAQRGRALGKEIERCFGVDAGSHLVRREGAGRARIVLRHELEGVSTPAVHELTFGDERWTLQSTIPDRLRIPTALSTAFRALMSFSEQADSERMFWTMDAVGALADSVLPSRHPAFYLPADRTGLMAAHSTVVSALIQSATMAGIRRADPLPLLSGVRGDFLEQLVEWCPSGRGACGLGGNVSADLGNASKMAFSMAPSRSAAFPVSRIRTSRTTLVDGRLAFLWRTHPPWCRSSHRSCCTCVMSLHRMTC